MTAAAGVNLPPPRLGRYVEAYEWLRADTIDEVLDCCAEDVAFSDPFNRVVGREAYRRVLEHMFEAVDGPAFDIMQVAGEGDRWFLYWRFTGHVRALGRLDFDGMSVVRLDAAGMIAAHEDHWDSGRHVLQRAPVIGRVVRWLLDRMAA